MGDDIGSGSICFGFCCVQLSAAEYVVYGCLTTIDDSLSLNLYLLITQLICSHSLKIWESCKYIIHSLIDLYVRRQNQVTCQNKAKTEERFISFTSVCRDLDFIKEMKYPNEKIESMTSIMLGDSSSDGLNVDNDKKKP